MKKHPQPFELTTFSNVNAPHTPGSDQAGIDEDFDAVSDDEREIVTGLRDLARMEGWF